jgi:5-oxoprolinase (ATP-hydrolysing)
MRGWNFHIDRGGTFTDIVAQSPDGREIVRKFLSHNPDRYEDAAIAGVLSILGEHAAGVDDIDIVKMGTTVATNALLERRGEKVALFITAGFTDALDIGHQARPDIFALNIRKPARLHSRVWAIDERVTADGEVLRPLDEDKLRQDLDRARADGFNSCAIACLHAWAHPAHERRTAELARDAGFRHISTSSGTSRLIRFINRCDTTVADAYLSPILDAYTSRIAAAFDAGRRLYFMQSNGGLTQANTFAGHSAILSGPAGGVAGMAAAATSAGFTRAIGFDMGGTSTDVSHFAGTFERTHDTNLDGVRISTPMLRIETVAAGGGSICRFDGARLRVGPQSAGADPGPACYRRGGPLTITDCNLILGRIRKDCFPAIFGPNADLPPDAEASRLRLQEICDAIRLATGDVFTEEEAALGFIEIADRHMAEAIRQISIQRGYDPQDYVLCAFGGAGGQHACAVAELVGVQTILLHRHAGVLSAWGMGLADIRVIREMTIGEPIATSNAFDRAIQLEREAREALAQQLVQDDRIRVSLTASLRYDGGEVELDFPWPLGENIRPAFETAHKRRFGFIDPDRDIVLSTLTAEAVAIASDTGPAPAPLSAASDGRDHGGKEKAGDERPRTLRREDLVPDTKIDGPVLITEASANTWVAPGWRAHRTNAGDLVLERTGVAKRPRLTTERPDPILLEIFNNRFMSIAEEMGLALQMTAASVNIRERLDFSCALFDSEGGLVANAPHIPVHLGSMGESIRVIRSRRSLEVDGRGMRRGDIYMLNAPHAGGTHLPDITIITPVFIEGDSEPSFFTAARGHHADIGGATPGSMPPDSRRIEDEGVVLDNVLLAENGIIREQEIRELLGAGPYPARNIERNMADLKAQVAACLRGAEQLSALSAEHGLAGVQAYMRHVQDNAAEQIRRVIDTLEGGSFQAPLDNGAVIAVRIEPDRTSRRVRVDFTGTSPQTQDNYNAPLAIARAAVLYVFRTLVSEAIPLNEGCMIPIDLIVPEGYLLNPAPGAAVVAGNVETSQLAVDVLYGALGALAASQGTMNNFTFGDRHRQYYETICGGAGAGPGFDGADAVQTHMTNSRLTDPEILEARFPVLLEAFSIRRGSGGAGQRRGGDGVIRTLRFRAPMTAAILATRRRTAPFGLDGGEPGSMAKAQLKRARDGVVETPDRKPFQVEPGDVLTIETPGGGGFGAPEKRGRR